MRFTISCWVNKAEEDFLRKNEEKRREVTLKMIIDSEMIGLPAGRVEFRREDTGECSDLPVD